jgi:hypothetical protein
MVLTAYQNNFPIEQIQIFSKLSKNEIQNILKRNQLQGFA